jgi:hypothetical protein
VIFGGRISRLAVFLRLSEIDDDPILPKFHPPYFFAGRARSFEDASHVASGEAGSTAHGSLAALARVGDQAMPMLRPASQDQEGAKVTA